MIHTRLLGVLAGVLAPAVASTLAAAPARAHDVTVTAAVTDLLGTRVITAAPNVVMTAGAAQLTGTLAVTVAESAKSGTNQWSVTARSTSLAAAGGAEIPASNLTMNPGTPVKVQGGGTVAAGSGGSLDTTHTLWEVNGQSPPRCTPAPTATPAT